jgi:dihydrofolate reductase
MWGQDKIYPWLKAIVAVGDGNLVIGNKGRLPWSYPEEAKFYRDVTSGHEVVVGRLTFEIEGLRNDVRTYVLSQTMKPREDLTVLRSIDEIRPPSDGKILWVCGGRNVYEKLLKHCSEIFVSYIHGSYEGDVFFPCFDHLFRETRCITDRPEWRTVVLERNDFGSG